MRPGNFDPWLAALYDWEIDPDPKKRVDSAKSIMRMLAAALITRAEIPAPLRSWLATCLRDAVRTGDANLAFRLRPGRGKYAAYPKHMSDAAQIHTVMQWHSISVQRAADEVASLLDRLDASNLVKHYANTCRRWHISGPFTAGPGGEPTQTEASPKDLANGAAVVVFVSKLTNAHRFVLRIPRDIAGLRPSMPPRSSRRK